jgi:hypothetical protein
MALLRNFLTKLFWIFLFLNVFSCSTSKTKSFSTNDDQYWSELVALSLDSKTSIIAILEKKNPSLSKQLLKDSTDPVLLDLWGQSLNFDSGAKKQIINDQIIADLQAKFGIRNDNKVVHAGITHTYGYLFSNLETPYGFKRKRWIDPTLNYAFSFSGNSLSPTTEDGTLLSNITYFAGKLAFRNELSRSDLSKLKNVSNEVLNFNYSLLPSTILDEQIMNKGAIVATLRTTMVKLLLKQAGEANDYLLIYSVELPQKNKEILITAFPIKDDAYKSITAKELTGANKPISIRYNAFLDGFMNQKLMGTRTIIKDSVI